MDLYALGLFVHLVIVVSAFSASSVLHSNLVRVKKAERAPLALQFLASNRRLAPIMPLFFLALLLSGAWLVDRRWVWSAAWVQLAVIGLVVMLLVSLTILKPRAMALAARLEALGDAPISDEARRLIHDPLWWAASHFQPIMATGIMFLMVMKPGLATGVAALLAAVVLAALSAVPVMRQAAATQPA